jgi:copper chaperone CopZ
VIEVNGMTCNSCKIAVETAASKVSGVTWVAVNVAQGHALVHYDPDVTPTESVLKAIRDAGFEAKLKTALAF